MVFHVSYRGQRTSNTVRAIPLKQEAEQGKLRRDRLRAKAVKSTHKKQHVKNVIAGKTSGRKQTRSVMYDL